MEEYASNSYKNKQTEASQKEKNIQKVVKGPVKVQRKSEPGLIFKKSFSDVKSYVVKERIVPGIKEIAWNFIANGIDTVRETLHMMIYENNEHDPYDNRYYDYSRNSRRPMTDRYSFSSYNANVRPRQNSSRPQPDPSVASRDCPVDELILSSSGEAEHIIDELIETAKDYDSATVADFYQLAGVTPNGNWCYNNFGWRDKDLESASVKRVHDGYLVSLPKPRHLD